MASAIAGISGKSSAVLSLHGVGSLASDRGEALSRVKGSFLSVQNNPIRQQKVSGPSPQNRFQSDPADMGNISDVLNQRSNQRIGVMIDGQV